MSVKVSSFVYLNSLLFCLLTSVNAQSQLSTDTVPPSLDQLLQGSFICYTVGIPIETAGVTNFNQGNLFDAWQLIIGRIPGVSITRPGGDPNGEFVIRVRGTNTLTGDWRPLIVVDGIAGVNLNNIDPNNVENIHVLKEAAAAAIYGMRAANGVVIITTKKADEGEPAIFAYGAVTVDQISRTHETLSPEAFVASGGTDYGSKTDWVDEITQTALSESAGVSIRQKKGNTSLSAAVNYRDIEGVIGASSRKRLNTSLYLNQSALNDKFSLSLQLTSTTENRDYIDPTLVRFTTLYNPTAPVFDDINSSVDGGYFQELNEFNSTYNPVALSRERILTEAQKRLLFSLNASYEVNSQLKLSGQYTQDLFSSLYGEWFGLFDGNLGTFQNGRALRNTDDRNVTLADFRLNYGLYVNDDLEMYLLLGAGFQKTDRQGFRSSSSQYLSNAQTFNNLGGGGILSTSLPNSDSYRVADRLNSLYGMVNIRYQQSLEAYVNVRSDAYSGFVNDKTGLFYGVGVSYEMTSVIDAGAFSELRLSLSHGLTGNLPFSPNLSQTLFVEGGLIDLDNDPLTTGDRYRFPQQLWNSNPQLTWEKLKETNLGLDFAVQKLNLSGTLNYFTRESTDLILPESVVIGSPNVFAEGFFTSNTVYSNLVDLSSSGVELSLNYNHTSMNSLSWQSGMNATFYQQPTVESINSATSSNREMLTGYGFLSPINGTNLVTQHQLGGELGSIHAPRYLGSNGGSPLLDGLPFQEWEKAGSSLPSADLGFYNSITKGPWRLSALVRGSFGHSLLNVTRMIHEHTPVFAGPTLNIVTSDLDEGLNATVISDLYVEDASFLRLNHLTVSREFALSQKARLVASVTGQNLFTITGYQGIDPEVRYLDANQNSEEFQALASGVAGRELYYLTRTWTFSLNVNF